MMYEIPKIERFGSNHPSKHKSISAEELKYILDNTKLIKNEEVVVAALDKNTGIQIFHSRDYSSKRRWRY